MADYKIRIISENGEFVSQQELDTDYITVIQTFADTVEEGRKNPQFADTIVQLIDNGDMVITEAVI